MTLGLLHVIRGYNIHLQGQQYQIILKLTTTFLALTTMVLETI